MIKITNKNETIAIPNIPEEVVAIVVEIATILDENYGYTRDSDHGLGGYILIAETAEDVKVIRNQTDLEHNLPEYLDLISYSNSRFESYLPR